jgi:hypothetical protein
MHSFNRRERRANEASAILLPTAAPSRFGSSLVALMRALTVVSRDIIRHESSNSAKKKRGRYGVLKNLRKSVNVWNQFHALSPAA